MSSEIFYSKTPIRANQSTPAFVSRLKYVAYYLKDHGDKKVLKEKHSSSTLQFSKDGITATFDKYYEDRTITVEGVGRVHYSMNRSESFFDINVENLKNAELKLGIDNKKGRSEQKAA